MMTWPSSTAETSCAAAGDCFWPPRAAVFCGGGAKVKSRLSLWVVFVAPFLPVLAISAFPVPVTLRRRRPLGSVAPGSASTSSRLRSDGERADLAGARRSREGVSTLALPGGAPGAGGQARGRGSGGSRRGPARSGRHADGPGPAARRPDGDRIQRAQDVVDDDAQVAAVVVVQAALVPPGDLGRHVRLVVSPREEVVAVDDVVCAVESDLGTALRIVERPRTVVALPPGAIGCGAI